MTDPGAPEVARAVDPVERPADERAVDPALVRLGDALAEAGVRWAVLRGETERPGEDDLDLLVHPADLSAFAGAARAAGFPHLPAWGHGHHRFHLGRGAGGWWRIDVVDRLRFARGEAVDRAVVEAVLDARSGGDVPQLRPDDRASALALHLLLDRTERRPGDADRLGRALADLSAWDARGPGALTSALDAALAPDGDTASAVRALLDRSPTVRRLRARARRAFLDRSATARWGRSSEQLARSVGARLRKPMTAARRSGPSIALLGPDGAGKSSLLDRLPGAFPLPVRTAYLGLYPADAAPRPGGPKGTAFLARLSSLWRRAARARVDRWRGRLVVFDRHPLDARLPVRGRSRARDRVRRFVLGHALPVPDLVIVLDAPGEVLHARKEEYPADVLEVERRRYRSLAASLGDRATVVDAARPSDAVLDDVVDRIWRVWAERLDGSDA